jgi:hypothetical protein
MMMDEIAADPEMRARMQIHAEMMQVMMGPDGMEQSKMKEMMGEHSKEDSEEHVH